MTGREYSDELKDQLALLLLLSKLKEFGFQTQRLKLQKLVYLADIFGTILKKKPTTYTFQVYKLGPFSKELFNDIERLVSIEAVKAKEIDRWQPNQDRSFEYEIDESRISRVGMIRSKPEFNTIEKSVELAVQAAGYLDADEIRRLVYSEPNYIEAKRKGFGTVINPEYTFSIRFREMSKRISSKEFGIELTEEEVLWLYLNFMRTTQSQKNNILAE
jgi:uncharacterized protein YwgA